MEIQFNPAVSTQLHFFATQAGKEPDELANEVLAHYFEEMKLSRLRAAVAAGDASFAGGRTYDAALMEEVAHSARQRVARDDVSTNSDATGF